MYNFYFTKDIVIVQCFVNFDRIFTTIEVQIVLSFCILDQYYWVGDTPGYLTPKSGGGFDSRILIRYSVSKNSQRDKQSNRWNSILN